MQTSFQNMDRIHYDVLTEVGSIGAGNAVTSLSKMMGKKISMQVPSVRLLGFNESHQIIGGAENNVFGILFDLSGEIKGKMMFVLEEESAILLVNRMLNMTIADVAEFGDYELSVLQEVGNILASSYLNSLATFINKRIIPSVPYIAHDMAGAIISVPAIEFGKTADEILFIESTFEDSISNVSGYFILIPDDDSLQTIMDSLGVM